jgi:hypothetical protein
VFLFILFLSYNRRKKKDQASISILVDTAFEFGIDWPDSFALGRPSTFVTVALTSVFTFDCIGSLRVTSNVFSSFFCEELFVLVVSVSLSDESLIVELRIAPSTSRTISVLVPDPCDTLPDDIRRSFSVDELRFSMELSALFRPSNNAAAAAARSKSDCVRERFRCGPVVDVTLGVLDAESETEVERCPLVEKVFAFGTTFPNALVSF